MQAFFIFLARRSRPHPQRTKGSRRQLAILLSGRCQPASYGSCEMNPKDGGVLWRFSNKESGCITQVKRSSQGNRIPRGGTMSVCVRHPPRFLENFTWRGQTEDIGQMEIAGTMPIKFGHGDYVANQGDECNFGDVKLQAWKKLEKLTENAARSVHG